MGGGYLFAYFTSAAEPDGEQVRFAVSEPDDPLRWHALNNGEPILRSSVGEGGVRDPFLLRAVGLPGETARYYLLASDLCIAERDPSSAWEDSVRNGSRSIVVWESADLVTWSEPRLLAVAPPEAGNAWAPEATFDEATGSYFVYWASSLYANPGDRSTERSYHRMLGANTTDFVEATPARIWVDRGWSVIDATVVTDGGYFYRFSKDERSLDSSTPAAKHITVERSRTLTSDRYELVAEGIGGNYVRHGEGPIVVPHPSGAGWYLFVDEFGMRRYLALTSDHLDSARWDPAEAVLPAGASHGSILPLTRDERERLQRAFA
jgi:hypothetical protein